MLLCSFREAYLTVFAHVSNNEGIETALRSGVDVVAHATPMDQPWSPAFAQHMVAAHACLTATLTLWEYESRKGGIFAAALEEVMKHAAQQLNAFLLPEARFYSEQILDTPMCSIQAKNSNGCRTQA